MQFFPQDLGFSKLLKGKRFFAVQL